MTVTFSDGIQLMAKVTSQVSNAHLKPLHLPLPWRLSPVLVRATSHLLLPSRLLVPTARQVAWQVPAGCDTDIPTAPGSSSTFANPSKPPRHDLKSCCWFCWKFDLTLCLCSSLQNTKDLLCEQSSLALSYFFFSLWKERKGIRSSFSHRIYCLSALCNRPLDIGSAPDNTWIDFPPHIWKVLGMTHLTPSRVLWVQL